MPKKKPKKRKVSELPTEEAIEALLPKEIVKELRGAAAASDDDDESNSSTKKES
jgi:hypothetical protein